MWRLNLSWPSSNRQRWSLGMGRLRPRGRSQQEHRWILLYFAGTLCYSRRLVLNCCFALGTCNPCLIACKSTLICLGFLAETSIGAYLFYSYGRFPGRDTPYP
ncbi:hypothetical protein V6Z12_A11G043700 [Gossypium hirsutum]